jgi:hypothetical protein
MRRYGSRAVRHCPRQESRSQLMSFGGFLGIGDRYHPLPWHVLTYDTGQGGYVVDLDRNKLEGAPTYGTSETPNWSDRRWGQQVHDYYGARPYWE